MNQIVLTGENETEFTGNKITEFGFSSSL